MELDPEGCRVRLPQGMQLDLGSIAKGWASDLLAELAGGEPAIFNLGGNVRTAGDKPDGSPWRIGIQTPEAGSSGYLGVLELTGSQAVITSGGYERYFEEDGQTYWHIMDPETAAPARSGLKSVTIGGELHHGVHGKYGRGGLPGLGAAGQQQGQHHGQEQESDRVHSVTSKDRDVLHTQ